MMANRIYVYIYKTVNNVLIQQNVITKLKFVTLLENYRLAIKLKKV